DCSLGDAGADGGHNARVGWQGVCLVIERDCGDRGATVFVERQPADDELSGASAVDGLCVLRDPGGEARQSALLDMVRSVCRFGLAVKIFNSVVRVRYCRRLVAYA